MKNNQAATATKNARRKSASDAAATKAAKRTRSYAGLKKRLEQPTRESALCHTSQKPPLERAVKDLLARRGAVPPSGRARSAPDA
jgi:hypothetical protein